MINYYNPEIPYYDPRYPQFYYNYNYPNYPGQPGGGGPGGPGGPGNSELAKMGPLPDLAPQPKIPAMVLYISCGEDAGPGRVYQVDDNGRVLGMVNLPYTATGLALHRTHGLVCALPRDGGRLMRIDDTGKVATILEKDPTLVHPVDVGVGNESDTIVVGDNIAHVLGATTTAGDKPKIYRKFDDQKWAEPDMSVAVTRDKHVIFGSNGPEGIFRYSGDNFFGLAAAAVARPRRGGGRHRHADVGGHAESQPGLCLRGRRAGEEVAAAAQQGDLPARPVVVRPGRQAGRGDAACGRSRRAKFG